VQYKQSTKDESPSSASMVWDPKPEKCVLIQWEQNVFWPLTKTQPASYLMHYWRQFPHREHGC